MWFASPSLPSERSWVNARSCHHAREPDEGGAGRPRPHQGADITHVALPQIPGELTGSFGPDFVNVVDQLNDPDSLLTFMQRMTYCYRSCPELGS